MNPKESNLISMIYHQWIALHYISTWIISSYQVLWKTMISSIISSQLIYKIDNYLLIFLFIILAWINLNKTHRGFTQTNAFIHTDIYRWKFSALILWLYDIRKGLMKTKIFTFSLEIKSFHFGIYNNNIIIIWKL